MTIVSCHSFCNLGSGSLAESGLAFVAVASIHILGFILKKLDSDSYSDPDPD
jgi:hypothetical protein